MVVGLGPGDRNYTAPAALIAIEAADVVVGYQTYLDLIKDIIVDKEVVCSGMRKEIDRAKAAIEHAKLGKNVVVVSSGDPGVYGMAGIVLELVEEDQQENSTNLTTTMDTNTGTSMDTNIEVEIIPGITAATAAAAALGAPLMHDFAVISLSDLLTPWTTIMNRLEAAGLGDFITVLYNPKSHGRQKHIETAREILLWHKDPMTPVGIVKNAYRGEQEIILTNLKDMLKHPIDMLTTVVVGNSQTKMVSGRMVTPRGYTI